MSNAVSAELLAPFHPNVIAGSECECAYIVERGNGALEPTSDLLKGHIDVSEDKIATVQMPSLIVSFRILWCERGRNI